MPKYDATEHWAKIEVDQLNRAAAVERLARRYAGVLPAWLC